MERRGWFFEKWGLETNPSQKERPAGGVSLPCASKLRRKCELKRGGNGKRGGRSSTYKRGWYVGKSRQLESTFLLVF